MACNFPIHVATYTCGLMPSVTAEYVQLKGKLVHNGKAKVLNTT